MRYNKCTDSWCRKDIMKTFLTEKTEGGKRWDGGEIHAESWDEAEEMAKLLGVEVCGVLLASIPA